MKEKLFSTKFFFLTGLILAAVFSRLIPHPPNFAPIAAIALFGGAYFDNKKLAFIVPFIALLISDLVIGFYDGMWAIYLSFALVVGIGFMLRNRVNTGRVAIAAVSSSVLFFVVTNFAVWVSGFLYPMNFSGLVTCYTAAIPFFHNTLIGDLVYSGALFGLYALAKVKYPSLVETKA
ncbi:MAG TPA: hypothetical protein PK397_07395 [Ignavibacteriaceae bacterium]|jgi:hypothetical protein|nr:hypothetical protein [Ignavibacteriaceae bacterium]